jgi:hypothetical protein
VVADHSRLIGKRVVAVKGGVRLKKNLQAVATVRRVTGPIAGEWSDVAACRGKLTAVNFVIILYISGA